MLNVFGLETRCLDSKTNRFWKVHQTLSLLDNTTLSGHTHLCRRSPSHDDCTATPMLDIDQFNADLQKEIFRSRSWLIRCSCSQLGGCVAPSCACVCEVRGAGGGGVSRACTACGRARTARALRASAAGASQRPSCLRRCSPRGSPAGSTTSSSTLTPSMFCDSVEDTTNHYLKYSLDK